MKNLSFQIILSVPITPMEPWKKDHLIYKGYDAITLLSLKLPPSFKVVTRQKAKTEISCILNEDRNRKKYL